MNREEEEEEVTRAIDEVVLLFDFSPNNNKQTFCSFGLESKAGGVVVVAELAVENPCYCYYNT